MANTDFFDDDLIKQRDAAKRIKLGPGDEPVGTLGNVDAGDEVPVRPVSDFNLTRMARHKHEVDDQVVKAMQELDRLRKRQDDLEREKRDLEDLQHRQDDYERGKREMIERFTQNLVTLEKEELHATRLAELLGQTRQKFKSLLDEIQAIDDEAWPEDRIRDELGKAVVVLDDARMEYNKAMAKIDAVMGGKKLGEEHQPVIFEEGKARPEPEASSFAHWAKIGLAVTTPLIVVILLLSAIYLILHANGYV